MCSDIQPLGADFVCGFIQMMDGEKDPLNLLLAFQSVRIIAQNLQLGTYVLCVDLSHLTTFLQRSLNLKLRTLCSNIFVTLVNSIIKVCFIYN